MGMISGKIGKILTPYGEFNAKVFYNGAQEIIVLDMGEIRSQKDVPCRIQSLCYNIFLLDINNLCYEKINNSLKIISDRGCGLMIYLLNQSGRGNGYFTSLEDSLIDEDIRDYSFVANVIKEYAPTSIDLISSNKLKEEKLQSCEIQISKRTLPFQNCLVMQPALNQMVRDIKKKNSFPMFSEKNRIRILVCGDLNFDLFITKSKNELEIGGTGYNAAKAFITKFNTILFGSLGKDSLGLQYAEHLNKQDFKSMVYFEDDTKKHPTCTVGINNNGEDDPPFYYDWNPYINANTYDNKKLEAVITLMDLDDQDYVFITSHIFVQKQWDLATCKIFFEIIQTKGSKIILDITGSSLKKEVEIGEKIISPRSLKDIVNCFDEFGINIIIASLSLLKSEYPSSLNNDLDYMNYLLKEINTDHIMYRYTKNDCMTQVLYGKTDAGNTEEKAKIHKEGMNKLNWEEKKGLTDVMIAGLLAKYCKLS